MRSLFKQSLIKFVYAFFIVASSRLIIVWHLNIPPTLPIEYYYFIFYQDCIAVLFIILIGYGLDFITSLFLSKKNNFRFLSSLSFYTLLGILSNINFKFFQLYDINLSWNELKNNLGEKEIWESILSELDILLVVEIFFWFFLSYSCYLIFIQIDKKTNTTLFIQKIKREIQDIKKSLAIKEEVLDNIIDNILEPTFHQEKEPTFISLPSHKRMSHKIKNILSLKVESSHFLILLIASFSLLLISFFYQKQFWIKKGDHLKKGYLLEASSNKNIIYPDHLTNFLAVFFSESLQIHTQQDDSENKSLYKNATDTTIHEASISPKFNFNTNSWLDKKNTPLIPIKRNSKYNIVLFLMESTSYAYMQNLETQNSVPLTPNWQSLSQNAIVFDKHYAEHPLSIQALFSILTSAYSMPGEIWVAHSYPKIEIPSIPSILGNKDFTTVYMHSGDLGYVGQEIFLKNRKFSKILPMQKLVTKEYPNKLNWGYDDRVLLKASEHFAKEAYENKKPYFLMLSPLTPHHPYEIPESSFQVVKDPNELKESKFISNISKTQNWFLKYINSLHYADFVMLELIQRLENLPNGENTIFFIMGDHGEAFAQHRGNFNHPFYIYEENVHVPFMIYNKKLFPKKKNYTHLSSHIDILPTILDILGLKASKEHKGRSLFRGGPNRIISFSASWRNHLIGLRDAHWKYIYNLKTYTDELYNLEQDPYEKDNRAKEEERLVREYREYLLHLVSNQRVYFETVLKQKINWFTKFDKGNL